MSTFQNIIIVASVFTNIWALEYQPNNYNHGYQTEAQYNGYDAGPNSFTLENRYFVSDNYKPQTQFKTTDLASTYSVPNFHLGPGTYHYGARDDGLFDFTTLLGEQSGFLVNDYTVDYSDSYSSPVFINLGNHATPTPTSFESLDNLALLPNRNSFDGKLTNKDEFDHVAPSGYGKISSY